jgi:hypothetical protein
MVVGLGTTESQTYSHPPSDNKQPTANVSPISRSPRPHTAVISICELRSQVEHLNNSIVDIRSAWPECCQVFLDRNECREIRGSVSQLLAAAVHTAARRIR